MESIRKWSLLRKITVSLLVFVMITCCSLMVWLQLDLFDPNLLATNADFTLPESARNTRGHFAGFSSFSMHGKFDMDATDFNDFKENANCITPFQPIDPHSSDAANSPFWWWKPSSNSLICSGGGDGCGKSLIVDIADTETYTVYVYAGCG